MESIGWGILGTGMIARKFAEGLTFIPEAKLAAVGSRSEETAVAFAETYDVPQAHAAYEALVQDPTVDVVYISTPHVYHMDNSLLCLEAGKAVLCEKPFTINKQQAAAVFKKARQKNLFIMEAMWTYFLPAMAMVRKLLEDGVIGQIRMLTADFGFTGSFGPEHRLLNPALGGGALLDVGIYPLALAQLVFGSPDRIQSMAHLGETGVDEQTAILLGYENGEIALLHTAVQTETPQEAVIMGTEGRLKIKAPWWQATQLILSQPGQSDQLIEVPFEGNGYSYEAIAVMSSLQAGRVENELMPWSTTLALQETMDTIRGQMGLRYPLE